MNQQKFNSFCQCLSILTASEQSLTTHFNKLYRAYISTSSDDYFRDSLSEIESNLWSLSKEDKENYIKKIIRDLDRVSNAGYNKHRKLFDDWCSGKESNSYSDIYERYVIKCLYDRGQFIDGLDIICTNFQLDIFQIQKTLGVDLNVNRKPENLLYYRHNELFTTEQFEHAGEKFEVKKLKGHTEVSKLEESEFTKPMIALICFYNGRPITRENALEVAKEFKHPKAGRLYQDFSDYNKTSFRLSVDDRSRIKNENKIKLFESVISYLNGAAKAKAIDELNTIKSSAEK